MADPTQNGVLQKDDNGYPVAGGVSDADNTTVLPLLIDPVTGRALFEAAGGSGTVTSVSVVSANGFAGSVADPTTTPAITLTTTVTGIIKGNGTAMSAAVAGTDYTSLAFKTIAVSGQSDVVADTPEDTLTLAAGSNITITTNAGTDTVTIAAAGASDNITVGTTTITSGTTTRILYDNAGVLGEYTITGTGTVVAMQTNPTLSGITITDATNVVLDTTTGTKFGTATTQKLAFYNSTPIVQPTGDVATALSNLGLVATPTVNSTTITVADEATDTSCFPVFVTAATGNLAPKSNAGLTFNSNTALLTATLLAGTTSVTSATIRASSNDSGSLGASGTAFSDLFLASGALIDFAAGNVVLTHSSGILTVSTGDLRVTSAGTNTASVVTVGGTQTLTSKTLTSAVLTTSSLSGTQLLAEGASIGLDPAGSADGAYSGITMTGTAGYTQAFGDLVYLDPTDSRWEAADANAASGADGDARGNLAMVVVAGTDGNPCTLLRQGIIRADAKFPSFTINNPIYVSETAGSVTQTQPVTTDVVIRIVGAALTADEMWFSPDNTWITHT